ncbi:MAG: Na+/H+ antiporter [Polyangiaceae bacterium]|jgi:CPA1 family monovalent cation:H+ antiporter|nr:Na+/H+ antiporter [Polyangiaceae bacterium]
MHGNEVILTVLFCIATAVAIAVRRLKIPYTVALVLAGLVLGSIHVLPKIHLTKELMFAVFLPGLIFEASFHMEYRSFQQNKLSVLTMAVPGVLAGIGLTAAALLPFSGTFPLLEGFTLKDTLLFGALLTVTDPIAVVALFKSLGAPKRLAVLVEGESLLNDGTGVVAFTLLLAVLGGGSFSTTGAIVDFIRIVGMGLFIGAAVGIAVSKLIQAIDDPMIEITLTTIAAYGSFIAAEAFHFSGVIATVVAGMLCGNYAARTGMSPSTRVAVLTFWEYVAFALNSMVFLLIGLEVNMETLLRSIVPVCIAFGAVLVARVVVVGTSVGLLSFTREKIPWRWAPVLTWGGLRGGLSMVLVLALPKSFPHREELITLTFGVVVLSILGQGLTMAPLLRGLGLITQSSDRVEYEQLMGELRAVQGARSMLGGMSGKTPPDVLAELQAEYSRRAGELEAKIAELHLAKSEIRHEQEMVARRRLLVAEKDAVQDALHHGAISKEVADRLAADIDARLIALEEEEHAPEPSEAPAAPPPS